MKGKDDRERMAMMRVQETGGEKVVALGSRLLLLEETDKAFAG